MDQVQFRRPFFEVKTLHERLKKLRRKREVDYFKAFDKQKNSSSISNALRCLSDVAKGGVLSTSGKVTFKRQNCTVLNFLQKSIHVVRKEILNNW